MREFLKSISPVTRAADLKKPTFILQPGKDTRVPVGQAQELVKALKANNAPVWYLEFDGSQPRESRSARGRLPAATRGSCS